MSTFEFNVLHEKSNGELMALPYALSRDIFLTRGVTLCNRFQDGVEEVAEILELEATGNKRDAITWAGVAHTLISVQEMGTEQRKEYRADDFDGTALGEDYIQDEDNIWRSIRSERSREGWYCNNMAGLPCLRWSLIATPRKDPAPCARFGLFPRLVTYSTVEFVFPLLPLLGTMSRYP
jgi:hypothetical protein